MCLSNTNLSVGVAFFVSVFFHTKRKCSEITISFIFGSYERVFDSGIRRQAVVRFANCPQNSHNIKIVMLSAAKKLLKLREILQDSSSLRSSE